MALSVPKTQEVSDNLIAAIGTSIGKTIPLLPKTFTRVLAKALSGVFILTYRYAGFSLLQMFAEHASFRETIVNGRRLVPLVEWGRMVGVGDPREATNARLQVVFVVINTDSSTLPAGRQLVHPGSGVIYILEQDVVLSSSPITTPVVAASDQDDNGGAGVLGNRQINDILEWANPIPQVSTAGATVNGIFETASDAETEAEYRERVVERFRSRPQGGAYADYSAWALDVLGILHVYPYTGDPGMVNVFVEATVATAADADGTPTQAQLTAVAASIQLDDGGLASRRPAGSLVKVLPITRTAFDVEVEGLVAVDEASTKATIEEALDDHFRSREPFITGLSRLPRLDRITKASVSGVVDEAASSSGATVTSVKVQQGGGEILAYSLNFGQKAKLGTPTYV